MFSEDLPLWEEMYVKKIIPHLPFTENLLLAHNEIILRKVALWQKQGPKLQPAGYQCNWKLVFGNQNCITGQQLALT